MATIQESIGNFLNRTKKKASDFALNTINSADKATGGFISTFGPRAGNTLQDLAQNPTKYSYANQLQQGNISKPLNSIPVVGAPIKKAFDTVVSKPLGGVLSMAPYANPTGVFKSAYDIAAPNKTLPERAMGALNTGLNVLGAKPTLTNLRSDLVVSPLMNAAAGYGTAQRRGENPLLGAYQSVTGEKPVGFGDVITDNPYAATALNFALPLAGSYGYGKVKPYADAAIKETKNTYSKAETKKVVTDIITGNSRLSSAFKGLVELPEEMFNEIRALAYRPNLGMVSGTAEDAILANKIAQRAPVMKGQPMPEIRKFVGFIEKLRSQQDILDIDVPKAIKPAWDKAKKDASKFISQRGFINPSNVDDPLNATPTKNTEIPMEGGNAQGQYILRQGQKKVSVMASPTTKNVLKLKDQKAAQTEAKAEFDQWNRAFKKQEGVRSTTGAINDMAKAIKQNTKGATAQGVESLKDISGFSGQNKDVYRIFKEVYGDRFPQVKQQVLDPFDKSKGDFVNEMETQAKFLDDTVVKGLGIKKGSKESAAVMEFGEKKRDASSLIAEFGEEKAKKIIEADRIFRETYDRLLDEINQVRAKIYPNNPEKIIPKRADYYRHFKEITQDFAGLKNIFDDPAGIPSSLSGISEYVKPKSKFLSFAQKRLGDKSDMDAVGGFIDYIRAFSYAKHIDPQISKFRALADDLASQTEEGVNKGKLNNFVEFLQDYANDLSGKTNPADRWIQKVIPGGRKAMKVVDWVNSRVKANTVVGNVGSMIAQLFNLPQGIASAGPVYFTKGAGRTLASVFDQDKVTKQSTFLRERYSGTLFNRFDTKLLDRGANFAGWATGIWDEAATKLIWNSHYEKALKEGVSNPVKYADDVTRSLVAGRGIGEVPLIQKSKMVQMLAPFQLEVNNMVYVLGDMVGQKQVGKLATFFAVSYLMNRIAENVRGSDVSFDPINAMVDAADTFNKEEDKALGAVKAGGRIAGEVISNTPYIGQMVGSMYPEYGFKVNDAQFPTREQFFGDKDPTRFGQGLIAEQAYKDPLYKLIPRVGGGQIKKTIEGIQTYQKGYSETPKGQVRFPIDQNMENYIRSALFGQYGSTNAREYFKNNGKQLGTEQSQEFKNGGGADYYKEVMQDRQDNREDKKLDPKDDSRTFLQKLFAAPEPDAESASAAEAQIDQYVDNNIEGLTPLQKEKLKKDIKDKKREYKRILRDTKLTDDQKNGKLSVIDEQIKALQKLDNKKKEKIDYSSVELTGNTEVDKAIISKQVGEITTQINDIVKQVTLDKMDATEADAQIKKLKDKQKQLKDSVKKSAGGVSKSKKVTAFRKLASIKPPKVKRIKFKAPRAQAVSVPQLKANIKSLTFKGKKISKKSP